MVDTTIRVKEPTYKAIVKARGAFEQTFAKKLTLDESIYLAASYINIVYEELQNLIRESLIEIKVKNDGTFDVKWSGLDSMVKRVLPRIIWSFQNFQEILKEKEKQRNPVVVGA